MTAVHRTIDYQATKTIFTWFVEQLTEAWGTGDVDKSKALLAEVFKLPRNNAHGNSLKYWERHASVIYSKNEKAVDRAPRSAYLSDLEELG